MTENQPLRRILRRLIQQPTKTPKISLDWVTIPAGVFMRGSDTSKDLIAAGRNETPQRQIYLPTYQIMRMPVTNAQYNVFVDATGHRAPANWVDREIPTLRENHPVIDVSWRDAVAFCTWIGVRLPSEAEWEKAARGTDGRIYPWGNQPPDVKRCNFNRNIGDTTPVDNYPAGASPYGVLDMAGNVWEWVNDWYQADYYNVAPDSTPPGPVTGEHRVLRGGSWIGGFFNVRSTKRNYYHPDSSVSHSIGFRCALTP